MGTCFETICKHRFLFPSIQHLAWLPQGRPQGQQKCGKNSKNINLRRYFKFNREASCNTSIQTFMCTATLCNLCYIVDCCELLCFLTKSPAIPQQLYKTASRSLSAIAEFLVINENNTSSEALHPTFPIILLKALKNFALLLANEHLNLIEFFR